MTQQQEFKAGLEDVIALNSTICFIDGKEGRLLYQGYDIHDLVEKSDFEEVVYLLWRGELPTAAALEEHRKALAEARSIPAQMIELLRQAPEGTRPMDILRSAVSVLAHFDGAASDTSPEGAAAAAVRLVAQTPTIVAAYHRIREGLDPIPPDPSLSLAANFLYMLKGERPSERHEKILDAALILHADHELNASTFAARVCAATLSDIYSAVTAAIGALKGPLHGGANEQVMRMLQEIGEPARAADWVRERLARREKIMGFGHRVYRTEDPRSLHLRRYSEELGREAGEEKWFQISEEIAKVVREEKGIYTNVDFYSASTYYMLGIPIDLYTPIFACSRMSGWTAHVLEQYANNRLIRPRAQYVGSDRRRYVPLAERG